MDGSSYHHIGGDGSGAIIIYTTSCPSSTGRFSASSPEVDELLQRLRAELPVLLVVSGLKGLDNDGGEQIEKDDGDDQDVRDEVRYSRNCTAVALAVRAAGGLWSHHAVLHRNSSN